MIDLKNLDALMDSEVRIGETDKAEGTVFYFNKMPAMKGWSTLLGIREAVSAQMKPEELSPDLLRIAMALPTTYVLKLQETMFQYVEFSNASTTPQQLKGAEDMAFDGLEPGAVMEILVRSLCVNFSPSFREIIDQISRVIKQASRTPRKKRGA
ncbi:MAG: hypothetical protein OXO51_16005 [Gemmatimonadota bacterium]|nr:hypothetical protein [Gemmatimonadota bacterium]